MSKSDFLSRLATKIEKEGSQTLSDKKGFDPDDLWVSTGVPELDYNLKTFGFKIGIIEIAGASRSGKTTMGLTVVGRFLKTYPEAVCIFMLSEERINGEYAARLGVDTDRVMIVRSTLLEDLFFKTQNKINELEKMWQDAKGVGKLKVILFWDSIGATTSRAEVEAFKENVKKFNVSEEKGTKFELKHAKMAAFAKQAREYAKAMFGQLYDKDIIFLMINHTTDNLNSPTGGKTSSGGTWREYFCWLRLQLSKKEPLYLSQDEKNVEVAQVTEVKVIKNDFGGYAKTDVEILFGHGMVVSDADMQYAVSKKIVQKNGEKGFKFANMAWNSPRTFYALYEEQHKMLPVLHDRIIEARHKDLLEDLNL